MKFYSVYKKSNDPMEKSILVKRGFSWGNFFFGILWALYKKLWDLALVYTLFMLIAKLVVSFYPNLTFYVTTISIALQVIISFYVHRLLEVKLISQGYQKIDFIAGDTKELALLRFFSNNSVSKKS
ncbi:MAG: DUF2628 domain-containing protein [Rickettsiales bacterium]|nr:DUF2628 domain-containing protein [Rickettsiales bacterium]